MGEYHQVTLSEWLEEKEQLRKELNNVREGFVRVGYVLRKMEESRKYEAEGYKSVAEFAEKEHGLKPSTTSRWMSINREFSVDGYSMQLDPKYLNMKAAQLTEMLTLTIEDREMIRPETKREDIRELKRLEKEEPSMESGLEQIVRLFLEENKDIHKDIISWMTFRPTDLVGLIERVNPSGNKSFRKNGMMLMMYEDYIKYKAAGKKPETVQWMEFFEIAGGIELQKEDEAEIDGEAAVEDPAESAGEESPEGSRREVAESRGVGDERRTEVSGENQGQGGNEGTLCEGGSDGIGDRTGNEAGDFGGSGTEGGELSGECGDSGEGTGEAGEGTGNPEENDGGFDCRSGQDRGSGTDSQPGKDGSGTEEEAEVEGVREADDRCGERKEAAHLPGYAEDPSNQAEKEESRSGSLTEEHAPAVGDVEESGAEEIAPAQFASETIMGEDGNPAQEDEDEQLTLPGKISQTRQEVRFCMREIASKVDFRKWKEALDAAEELVAYLSFLVAHDMEEKDGDSRDGD